MLHLPSSRKQVILMVINQLLIFTSSSRISCGFYIPIRPLQTRLSKNKNLSPIRRRHHQETNTKTSFSIPKMSQNHLEDNTPPSNQLHPPTSSSHPSEWKSIPMNELKNGKYSLLISAIVPRPVAVITSLSCLNTPDDNNHDEHDNHNIQEKGIVNCAPFSYTGLLSHDPPTIAHGLCLSKGKKKDTLVNIENTGEWVFNLLTDNYLEEANQCSAAYPPTVSEITETNLTTLPSKSIQTPRLQQAKISMECKLDSTKELYNERGEHTTTIVIGTIVHFHIHESVLKYKNDDKDYPIVDLEQLRAVGRAGDISYWPTGEGKVVKMTRP